MTPGVPRKVTKKRARPVSRRVTTVTLRGKRRRTIAHGGGGHRAPVLCRSTSDPPRDPRHFSGQMLDAVPLCVYCPVRRCRRSACGGASAPRQFSGRPRHREHPTITMFFTSESRSTGRRPGSGASAVGGPVATFNPTRNVQEDTLSYAATRRKRFTAGVIAGALALTVTPILGFTGTASALDDATGDGSVCADPPNAEPFTDVSDTDPSNAEITCLVNSGVTTGVTATTYSPTARSPAARWRCSSSASLTRPTPTTPVPRSPRSRPVTAPRRTPTSPARLPTSRTRSTSSTRPVSPRASRRRPSCPTPPSPAARWRSSSFVSRRT